MIIEEHSGFNISQKFGNTDPQPSRKCVLVRVQEEMIPQDLSIVRSSRPGKFDSSLKPTEDISYFAIHLKKVSLNFDTLELAKIYHTLLLYFNESLNTLEYVKENHSGFLL